MPEHRVVHITIEKCGSQWVKNVLTWREVLGPSGLSYSTVTGSLAANGEMPLPPGTLSGPIYNMNQWEWRYWRRPGDRAVVVVRDPRDVLVSLMFAWLYNHPLDGNIQIVRRILAGLPDPDDRLTYVMGAIGPYHRMIWSWAASRDETALVSHYEDLVAAPIEAFSRIVDWLGWGVGREALAAAIDAMSFRSQSGRSRGDEDRFSHHRRGEPGDWRNYFTQEHGRLWETLYPGLLRTAGYEESDNWWEALPERLQRPTEPPTDHSSILVASLRNRNGFLEHEVEAKERAIRNLASACDQRLAVIEEKERIIRELAAACDERLAIIEEKERVIVALAAGCDEGLSVIEEKERMIRELAAACDERLAVIKRHAANEPEPQPPKAEGAQEAAADSASLLGDCGRADMAAASHDGIDNSNNARGEGKKPGQQRD